MGPTEVRATEIGAAEVAATEDRVGEVRPAEVRVAEMRSAEQGPRKVRAVQVRFAEIRVDRRVRLAPGTPSSLSLAQQGDKVGLCHRMPAVPGRPPRGQPRCAGDPRRPRVKSIP